MIFIIEVYLYFTGWNKMHTIFQTYYHRRGWIIYPPSTPVGTWTFRESGAEYRFDSFNELRKFLNVR